MYQAEIDAQITTLPATPVCYIAMHGGYHQMPKGFEKLYGWLGALGLTPTGMPMTVYLTDPSNTPEGEAEWELWAPFDGEAAETGPNEKGLGVKNIDELTVASTTHRGPYDTVRPTYTALHRWIADRSYEPSGPPMEVYVSDPAEVAPEDTITEIRIPVRKVTRPAHARSGSQFGTATGSETEGGEPGSYPPEATEPQPHGTMPAEPTVPTDPPDPRRAALDTTSATPQRLPLEERARELYSEPSEPMSSPPRHVPQGE